MKEFEGKVAVVTGAGQGIGRALVEKFTDEGMKVVLADLVPALVEQATVELRGERRDVLGVVTDVTSLESVEAFRDATLDAFGAVHLVCNNAGIGSGSEGQIWEHHVNDWRWSLDVNVMGVVNGINAFVPTLLASGEECHVVNTTSSNGGFTPLINSAVYATTKAAVTTITECLWGQLRETGATVGASLLYPSTHTPGMLNTGSWRPGANRPDRYDRPGAPPTEGRDALGEYQRRMDAAGLPVVFAPLSEVADLCFDGIRDDVFWITYPSQPQQAKIRARAESQIAQTAPDYLLETHMMAAKPATQGVTGSPALGPQRAAFAVPPEIAYFNTATLAPQLHRVRAAGEAALERRARPWTITADDWFADVERLRVLFAQLVGADADGVALVPATSYAFAVAARNLSLHRGDRVLVLAEEYPSGIYTWQAVTHAVGAEILTVHRERGRSWADAVLDALDERVRVVSVPPVHWTDGALVDLDAVSARTHEVGARLVIDGSQSIGAIPFDVATLRPDFVTTVGYKWLLGPMGLSYLYVAEEHRDGVPIEQNWIARAGSENFARLVDYRDEYQPGARRFDVGQRTEFELLPMAIAALEQLGEWRVERIATTLADVTASIADIMAALGLDPMPPDERGPHMLGVRLPEAVRSAVVPGLAAANCFAAVRGETLRLAPHLHVDGRDIERLADALALVLAADPS